MFRKKDLDRLYAACCDNHTHPTIVNQDDNVPEGYRKEAERIAKGLYNGSITSGSIDPAMTKLVAVELRKAVIEGFGKDLSQLDYGTPDYNKLSQLEKNVFHFSGAKNYQQLKSMSLALKDENGIQREYSDFKKEALKINAVYNGNHLRTEYDTATGSAQMAGLWVDIQEHKDIYPVLEFDAVIDSKTTDLCRRLNGTLLPPDHPFWKMYYPPNHFNERSTVRQRSAGSVTQNIPDADIPDMFRNNLAEQGFVFPEKHPYYIDCPGWILKQAELMRDNVYSALKRTGLMKADVFVSNLADEVDLAENIAFSRRLAEHGEEVFIRPHSDHDKVKNPELKLVGTLGDYKVDKNKATIEKFVRNSLNSANKQGTNIPVIVIEDKRYNRDEVWQALRGELIDAKRKKNISHVWLLLDKKLVKLDRASIVKDAKDLLP
ncbi:MAG: phage minor head protein [Sediminibacterium sp.]|nr:phage minor head protein [Sediminibacterium sp.]MDP3128808.1 phage minor head protein [Sediminibacterium sp.]